MMTSVKHVGEQGTEMERNLLENTQQAQDR